MYYLLTEDFKSQEPRVVEIITTRLPVNKIFFLGSTLIRKRTESIFMPEAPTKASVDHYYLLVIIDDNDKSPSYYQDIIENKCLQFIPVTAVVLSVKQFALASNDQGIFEKMIKERAVLLYQSENVPKKIRNNSNNPEREKDPEKLVSLVSEFIEGAEFYISRCKWRLSVFLVHQAIEQTLHVLLWRTIGLKFNTHNIDRLMRYASMVNYKIDTVFSKDSNSNVKDLQLLKESYHDTRYKGDYKISEEKVLHFLEKAKSLHKILLETKNQKAGQL